MKGKVPHLVYRLIDPRDESTRYIGITRQSLAERLRAHIAQIGDCFTSDEKRLWIVDLLTSGLIPEIERIDHAPDLNSARALEGTWYQYYRERGAILLNAQVRGGHCQRGYSAKISRHIDQLNSKGKLTRAGLALWRQQYEALEAGDDMKEGEN